MMIKDYKLLIELQHPYGKNTFKVSESEMLSRYKWLILMTMWMKNEMKY